MVSARKSLKIVFQQQMQKFDIPFLSKTSQTDSSAHNLKHPQGYLYDLFCRKIEYKKGRSSSGILLCYRKQLKDVLKVYDKTSDNTISLQIARRVVCDQEIYIAGVYNSPKTSSYTKRVNEGNNLDTLHQQLHFSSSNYILITGFVLYQQILYKAK